MLYQALRRTEYELLEGRDNVNLLSVFWAPSIVPGTFIGAENFQVRNCPPPIQVDSFFEISWRG